MKHKFALKNCYSLTRRAKAYRVWFTVINGNKHGSAITTDYTEKWADLSAL